jgi:hypothetical protein
MRRALSFGNLPHEGENMAQRKKRIPSRDRCAANASKLSNLKIVREKILDAIREEIALLRFKKLMLENAGKFTFADCDE